MRERTFYISTACQNDWCAEEVSYPIDMLRWWNDKPICNNCFDDLLREDKLKPGMEDEDDLIDWSDLPALKLSEARV